MGLVHIYCGDGKGKTSAAVGLAVRAAGCGKRVVIARFLKTDNSGEVEILKKIPEVTLIPCRKTFGFVRSMDEETKRECAAYHRELFGEAVKLAEHAARYEEELKKQNQEEREETKDRVTLSTMHSAKGLEYPVVFVVDANEGIVPHHKAGLPADIEEERRLFYVALTRAKDRLHVAAVKERYHRKTDVSRFVEEAGL